MFKLKYFLLITPLLIAGFFIPYKWPANINNLSTNEAIVENQECGCDCPNTRIIKGTFTIPDSLSAKIKNPIYEADLDTTPYYNLELWGIK